MKAFVAAVLVAFLVAPALAQDDAKGETVTLGGETYVVVPDEKMRALGFEFPDVPAEENAATDYLKAFEVYWEPKEGPVHKALRDVLGDSRWSGDAGPLIKQYVEKNEKTLAFLEQAAAKPACHFPFLVSGSWSPDDDVPPLVGFLLPCLGRTRALARFLVVVGKVREFEGRHAEALHAYLLIFPLAEGVPREQFLIGGLVSIACDAIGIGAIEQCLVRRELDDQTLAWAQKRVHELSKQRPSFAVAMRNDRILSTDMIEWMIKSAIRNPGGIESWVGEQGAWAMLRNQFFFRTEKGHELLRRDIREFWDKAEQRFELPLPEYLRTAAEFEAETLRAMAPGSIVRGLVPVFGGRVRLSYGRDELRWVVLDVEFALARYKARHGVYPVTLNELWPFMLTEGTDPFSGEPLHYRREADGSFTIWSIGENLVDDGGKVEAGKRWQQDDYVWNSRLLRVEE